MSTFTQTYNDETFTFDWYNDERYQLRRIAIRASKDDLVCELCFPMGIPFPFHTRKILCHAGIAQIIRARVAYGPAEPPT